MYRRSFISSSAFGVAGLGLRGLAADDGPKDLEIIDCHTHFYDPKRPEGVPWPGKDTALYRTVLPEHLRALKQFRHVTGTVIVEASPWVEDNQWLLDLAKDDPFIVGIVGNLKPGDADFAKLLRRFAKYPLFRGIRVNVGLLKQLVDKNETADFQLMADLDLSLDVNGGPDTPAALARLASKLPTLRIVLNHMGNVRITKDPPPADWQAGIAEAAKHPNVFAKISGLVEGAAQQQQSAPHELDFYRPTIDVVWRHFGDNRVIYGSNWPVSERAADYETVQRLVLEYAFERGEQATRQFCSLNAMKAYKWVKRDSHYHNDTSASVLRFRVSVDRGQDLGQCFGSLMEATSDDGQLTVGAGFQNAYNTRLRADRHSLQFYVHDRSAPTDINVTKVPRPNELCGTYLHSIDDQLISTYGGYRKWNPGSGTWQSLADMGGTGESMRVAKGILEFGESRVSYDGRVVLDRPDRGDYQMFFYANGYLCFYHVARGEKGYRPFQSDDDGFSRLIACPWKPSESQVDLTRAIVYSLPVVGETTFAWGVLGDQIVTGSNIGGFYRLAGGKWDMLRAPDIGTSFQLYSSLAYHDRLLMGQYPTGHLFAYDGQQLREMADWPPCPEGFSNRAREAQTTAVYGGVVMVGVWPWGELWRLVPDGQRWTFVRRMFDHPKPAPELVHPYDSENSRNAVPNLWGQRITSLIPLGDDLWLSTSAKSPVDWDANSYPFLAPDLWRSYGQVYRLTTPGHLSVPTVWTEGPTIFELTITTKGMTITQDGVRIGWQPLNEDTGRRWCQQKFSNIQWGQGIYGRGQMKVKPLSTGTANHPRR